MKRLLKLIIFFLVLNILRVKYFFFKKSYSFKNNRNITFFDRSFPNPQADASARTFWELATFLKDRNYKLNFIFINLLEQKSNKLISKLFDITSLNKLNFNSLFSFYKSSDLIFVKSPENFLFLEILFFFRTTHTVLFYGGDIYQKRFYSSLKYKIGIDYVFSYLEYYVYKHVEKVLWTNAFACFSPNDEEKDFINGFNKKSLVLPIRVFDLFHHRDNEQISRLLSKETINLIFVGGSGHQPNIRALKANINFFITKLNDIDKYNFTLNIVGGGWDHVDFSSLKSLSSRIIFHGRLNDQALIDLYDKCLFSISLIKDGAGVKGKVIEAMHQQNIILTSDIGGQGIPKDILPTFKEDNDLLHYILSISSGSIDPSKVLFKYNSFLEEKYSIKTYEMLFNQVDIYLNEELKKF